MKARSLLILALVAAVLAGLFYWTRVRPGTGLEATEQMGQPVLAALQNDETVGRIARIVFEAGEATVIVQRADNLWVSPGKNNYPVNFDRAREFIQSLRDLKVGQVLDSEPQERELLGLTLSAIPPTNPAAVGGTRVRLEDAAGNALATLIIGKERRRASTPDSSPGIMYGSPSDGRYIEVEGKVYLVGESFAGMPMSDQGWLDTRIVDVAPEDLVEVTAAMPEGEPIVLSKSAGGGWALSGLGTNEPADAARADMFPGLFRALVFNDIAALPTNPAQMGFDNPKVYTAKTKRGEVYTLKVGETPEAPYNRYVTLNVALAPEAAADTNAPTVSEAEIKTMNARLSPWVYIVPAYRFSSLATNRAELVRPTEPPAPEPAAVEP